MRSVLLATVGITLCMTLAALAADPPPAPPASNDLRAEVERLKTEIDILKADIASLRKQLAELKDASAARTAAAPGTSGAPGFGTSAAPTTQRAVKVLHLPVELFRNSPHWATPEKDWNDMASIRNFQGWFDQEPAGSTMWTRTTFHPPVDAYYKRPNNTLRLFKQPDAPDRPIDATKVTLTADEFKFGSTTFEPTFIAIFDRSKMTELGALKDGAPLIIKGTMIQCSLQHAVEKDHMKLFLTLEDCEIMKAAF